jgi:hypothetical protein
VLLEERIRNPSIPVDDEFQKRSEPDRLTQGKIVKIQKIKLRYLIDEHDHDSGRDAEARCVHGALPVG